MQSRLRNARTNWTVTLAEPVSGNYYPVNCLMRQCTARDAVAVPCRTFTFCRHDKPRGGDACRRGGPL